MAVNVLEDYAQDKSRHTYDKILEQFSVRELEEAIIMTRIGEHFDYDVQTMRSLQMNDKPNKALELACKTANDDPNVIRTMTGIYQYAVQVERFRRNKQCYLFDKDFLTELSDTETKVMIPYDIFKRLPFKSVYLDFSENQELVKEIGAEGVLAQVESIVNYYADDETVQSENYVMFLLTYRDGACHFTISNVLPNEKEGDSLDFEEFLNSSVDNKKTNTDVEGYNTKKMFAVILQSLLYLCSYEPDIREGTVSKQRYKKAKQASKNKKNLPQREYKVGERFGDAYRKWTKGSLGASHESTGTGSKKRPHVRKAHWHRYWTGRHGTDERRLIIKWVSETFCGLTESETDIKLDTVTHKAQK